MKSCAKAGATSRATASAQDLEARSSGFEPGLGHQLVGVGFHIGLELLHEIGDQKTGGNRGQEFNHRQPRFAQDAAFGPEDPDIGGNRIARLDKLGIQQAGADLVGFCLRGRRGCLGDRSQAGPVSAAPATTSAFIFATAAPRLPRFTGTQPIRRAYWPRKGV